MEFNTQIRIKTGNTAKEPKVSQTNLDAKKLTMTPSKKGDVTLADVSKIILSSDNCIPLNLVKTAVQDYNIGNLKIALNGTELRPPEIEDYVKDNPKMSDDNEFFTHLEVPMDIDGLNWSEVEVKAFVDDGIVNSQFILIEDVKFPIEEIPGQLKNIRVGETFDIDDFPAYNNPQHMERLESQLDEISRQYELENPSTEKVVEQNRLEKGDMDAEIDVDRRMGL